MTGMAALGLTYALLTTQFRRDNDRKKTSAGTPDVPLAKGPTATPPAKLAGLGYLPPNSAVVAGLHLAELLQDDEGKKLWQQLRDGPGGTLVKLVEDRTGLKAEEIDHLVLGASTESGRLRAVLVIRTVRPLHPKALAKALSRARVEHVQGRTVYRFGLGGFTDGLVWQPDDKTLIVSLAFLGALPDPLAVPQSPRQGTEGLLPVVKECLTQRLHPASVIWAVGSLKDLPGFAELTNLGIVPEKVQTVLGQLKAFTAGLRFQGGVGLEASLQGSSEKAAREVFTILEKARLPGATSYTVAPPPGPTVAETPDQRSWVVLQIRASPAEFADLIDRLMPRLPGVSEQ
jgi:hypothetical protein